MVIRTYNINLELTQLDP